MRKICLALVIVAMLFVTANVFAGSMTISGSVKDGSGKVIPGAKVVFKMLYGDIVAYTNSIGKYSILYHNFCDYKTAVCSKTGFFTKTNTYVADMTCWGCNPECPPAYAEGGCSKTLTVNFTLVRNILAKPLALRPEVATEENRSEIIQFMLGLYIINYCNANVCDYECLYQGVVDFINGPEHMYGKQTRPNIELPPCPDIVTFVDFVNNWMDAMWEYFYGDNFPDEETPEE